MMVKLRRYFKSNQFKNTMYKVSTLSLMTYTAYLALTLDKLVFIPNRAETSGYDGYEDD